MRERWSLFAMAMLVLCACSSPSNPTDGAVDTVDRATDATGSDAADVPADATDGTAADAADGMDANGADASDVPPVDARDASDTVPVDAPADASRIPINHRPDDAPCSGPAPAGNCTVSGGVGACSMDSQCTAGTSGRCIMNAGGAIFCRCTYDACANDRACASGQTCACHGTTFTGGTGNTCTSSGCRIDSDCGAGGFCSPSRGASSCSGLTGYFCHTPSDTCVNDSDCPSSGMGPQICVYSSTNARWECQTELFCP